ncbi:MAG: PASTA domain-containing protein [Ruminococcaceae bacterium]|nr:PASTA domain-containing protein [Oscillospiraceae bacterium]
MEVTLSKMKKRAYRLFIVLILLLLALILRIFHWQVIEGGDLREAALNQQTNATNITASRGTIYDRNGKAIAESATVNTLVCNPQDIAKRKSAEELASRLAPILDMEYDQIYKILTKGGQYQRIKKRISMEETQAIEALKKEAKTDKDNPRKFDGLYFEEDSKRYYSYGIAPHILGFTGFDNNGLQGIELTFDDVLMGKPGSILSLRSSSGVTMDVQYEEQVNDRKGADIVLTLDETMQHILEKHLEQAVSENLLREGAAGIIMNPKTAEIYAMATKPDFDLNNPNSIERFVNSAIQLEESESEEIQKYFSKDEAEKSVGVGAIRNKMWRNKAISDTYEPGSTFKILTAAMALEENAVTLDTPFYCSGAKQVGDYSISCHKKEGHGAESFLQGVQNSCNPVFMEVGQRVGPTKFMEYFKAFGLTQKTNIELIGESGSIYYRNKLGEVDLATSSFGQGFSITPIQLITAVSAVINGGNLMKPQIIKEIRDESGVVKTYQPEIVNRVISKETSDTMREILETVVSSPNGGGKNAYIKGYRIGGKTGTSEKGRKNDKRIASFIGFAPADDPQIICLIMLDEPRVAVRYGGTIAAPVVGSIIEETLEYLGVERQYTSAEINAVTVSVPELRGMEINAAKEQAKAGGFQVRVIGEGTAVLDQLPKPSVIVGEHSTVILYTEEGDDGKYTTVPNILNLSPERAKAELEDYGLNFEAVGAGLNSTSGAYAVKQSVEPGEQVPRATVISVEFRHSTSD